MKHILYALFVIASFASCSEQDHSARYLGQTPPQLNPEKFAPEIISTPRGAEFGSIFTRDAKTFYYAVDIDGKSSIRQSTFDGNTWSKPVAILQHGEYSFNDPFLSKDESRLYFISDRATDGAGPKKDFDIWYLTREGDTWSEPKRPTGAINTQADEYYVSISDKDKMFFSSNVAADSSRKHDFDIYSASLENDSADKAFRLGDAVNSDAYESDVFIAPDESYLIFSSVRKGGYGKGDLYISFKNPDGSSTKAVNMGLKINSKGHELSPFVTRDGKYLFFSSEEDIYWVDARIIELLKN